MVFTAIFILFGVMIMGVVLGIIGQNLVSTNDLLIKKRKKMIERFFFTNFLTKGWYKPSLVYNSFDLIDNNIDVLDITQPTVGYDCSLWLDFMKVCGRTGPFFVLLIICGMFIGYFENWDTITTIYYCIVTMTTVGYGDITPKTQSMRLFAVVFIPLSVSVMANFLTTIGEIYMERKEYEVEQEFLNRKMTEKDFDRMDINQDGSVDYGEFLSFMLISMRKTDKDECNMLRKVYDSLCTTRNGSLLKKDLMILTRIQNSNISFIV